MHTTIQVDKLFSAKTHSQVQTWILSSVEHSIKTMAELNFSLIKWILLLTTARPQILSLLDIGKFCTSQHQRNTNMLITWSNPQSNWFRSAEQDIEKISLLGTNTEHSLHCGWLALCHQHIVISPHNDCQWKNQPHPASLSISINELKRANRHGDKTTLTPARIWNCLVTPVHKGKTL